MAHILIVDDDEAVRELLKQALAHAGHTSDEARNGSEGLELARQRPYALVILDRSMPRMNGLEVLQIFRASPALKALKVLMCTSANRISEIDEAFAAGADDYLTKPIDLGRLAAKVAKHSAAPSRPT